ncbi:hypothetical protein CJU90_0978 [Yarrowia sp. C11]|nr:hypothetical protein CKK34_2391 [Yarrowia sp. E02]KAG5373289.1 hypothetical protein CJU90_0978 [Yarrowia sp. C11]
MSFQILQAALVTATLVVTALAVVQMKNDLHSIDIIPADGYIITLASLSAVYMMMSYSSVIKSNSIKVVGETFLCLAWLAGTILIGVQRGGMSCFSVAEVTNHNSTLTHMTIKVLSQANCNLGNASIALSAVTFVAFCVSTYMTVTGNYSVVVVPKGHQRLPQDDKDVVDKC